MHIHSCLFITVMTILPLATYGQECTPTPHRTTGTHYEPVTKQRVDISTGVIIKGHVLASPDCKPVPRAKIAHWQAGEDGRYSDRLRAYLYSDNNGYYQFETEWPDMPSPHIHFIVIVDGFEVLETQWLGNQRQKVIEFDMVLRKK